MDYNGVKHPGAKIIPQNYSIYSKLKAEGVSSEEGPLRPTLLQSVRVTEKD